MGSHLLYLYSAASRASRVRWLSAFSPAPIRRYCETTSKESIHHHHETGRAPSLAEEFERVAEEFEKIAEEKTHQSIDSDHTNGVARVHEAHVEVEFKEQPVEKGKLHETGEEK